MLEQINLISIEGCCHYYSIQVPSMEREILFKVWCFEEPYTLEQIYNAFNKAIENSFTYEKVYRHTLRPFYMLTLYPRNNEINLNNFGLFEYERFYKNNENACVYLKSVCLEVNCNGFNYYFESFDGQSDLHNEEVFDYCEKYCESHIKEFERLFHTPYDSTEYYM